MWQVSVPARLETYTTDVIITVCNLSQIYLSLSCSTFLLQILLGWKSIEVQSVHINLPVPCFSPFTISPRCRLVIFHNILKSFKPLTIWRRLWQQATSVHLSPLILICFRLKPNPHCIIVRSSNRLLFKHMCDDLHRSSTFIISLIIVNVVILASVIVIIVSLFNSHLHHHQSWIKC